MASGWFTPEQELEDLKDEVRQVRETLEEMGIDPGNKDFADEWRIELEQERQTLNRSYSNIRYSSEEDYRERNYSDPEEFFHALENLPLHVRVERNSTSAGEKEDWNGWEFSGESENVRSAEKVLDTSYQVPYIEEIQEMYDRLNGATAGLRAESTGKTVEEALEKFQPRIGMGVRPVEDTRNGVYFELSWEGESWNLDQYHEDTEPIENAYTSEKRERVEQILDEFDMVSYSPAQISDPVVDESISTGMGDDPADPGHMDPLT